jgi:methylphosphotriester-DNA--protein-cysteine methyltransferase
MQASTLTDCLIYDDANLGIGTTKPFNEFCLRHYSANVDGLMFDNPEEIRSWKIRDRVKDTNWGLYYATAISVPLADLGIDLLGTKKEMSMMGTATSGNGTIRNTNTSIQLLRVQGSETDVQMNVPTRTRTLIALQHASGIQNGTCNYKITAFDFAVAGTTLSEHLSSPSDSVPFEFWKLLQRLYDHRHTPSLAKWEPHSIFDYLSSKDCQVPSDGFVRLDIHGEAAKRCKPTNVQPTKINWRAFHYYDSLRKLWKHVQQKPETCMTLSEAANIAAMERTHFSKFFRSKVGTGFKYWEDVRKIERAKQLFDASDISVTNACLDAGFKDLTTFERTFKRITGVSPSQYKRAAAVGALKVEYPKNCRKSPQKCRVTTMGF